MHVQNLKTPYNHIEVTLWAQLTASLQKDERLSSSSSFAGEHFSANGKTQHSLNPHTTITRNEAVRITNLMSVLMN